MKKTRRPAPPRGYMCWLAVSRRKAYIAVGDLLTAIPAAPWLPAMSATPMITHGWLRYVDITDAYAWVPALRDAGHKEPAEGLSRVLDWAIQEAADVRTANVPNYQ